MSRDQPSPNWGEPASDKYKKALAAEIADLKKKLGKLNGRWSVLFPPARPWGGRRKGAGRPAVMQPCPNGCGFTGAVRALGEHGRGGRCPNVQRRAVGAVEDGNKGVGKGGKK